MEAFSDSAVAYVARGTYRESHACNQSQLYPYCLLSELWLVTANANKPFPTAATSH